MTSTPKYPHIIDICPDLEVRQSAIEMYLRGSQQERNAALLKCARVNTEAEIHKKRADRVQKYKEYLDYATNTFIDD